MMYVTAIFVRTYLNFKSFHQGHYHTVMLFEAPPAAKSFKVPIRVRLWSSEAFTNCFTKNVDKICVEYKSKLNITICKSHIFD